MPALVSVLLLLSAWLCSAQDRESLPEKFRKAADYKVIQADFRQVRELPELDMKVEIRGEMICEKSGRLRWQVRTPVRSITLIGQDELRHFDGETGKLAVISPEKLPWPGILRDCMTDWISGDPDRLKRRFNLEVKDARTLRLRAKNDPLRQLFNAVEIRISADFNAVEQIRIEEKSGGRLTIHFSQVRKNPVLPDQIWQLPPP